MNGSQLAGFCALVGVAGYPLLCWVVRKLDERRTRKTLQQMRNLN